jgi:hypothetical protein
MDALNRRSEGHLGLRLVADRVHDAGGVLQLGERPGGGGGASVTAVFPAVPGTSLTSFIRARVSP